MKEKEKHLQAEVLFKSIQNFIETGNHTKISESLNELNRIETDFLDVYSNRKKEGAYYTQESVSNFIVSQGITFFLQTYLKSNQFNKLEDIYSLDDDTKSRIKQKILKFSIIDPACGSGVFLLSATKEIYKLMRKLEPELDIAKIKLHILENIFGSEINDYARKLCIMKLFRWAYSKNNLVNSKIFSILNSNILLEDSLERKKSSKYDLVIGNPPYGNILDKNQKERLKSEDIFYNDIYCAFLLKSLEWTDGLIGYLVPKSFLLRQGYIRFRKKLLSLANLLKIYDIGPNLFAKATNEVQILFYEKKSDTSKDVEVYQYPNTEIVKYPKQKVDYLRVCFNNACPLSVNSKKIYAYVSDLKCPYCNSKTLALNRIRIKPNETILNLVTKIEKIGDVNYLNISRIPNMIRGEEDKGLKLIINLIEENTNNSCYFIKAKGDFNYYYFNKDKSFAIENLDPKILKGNNFEFYTDPKLLIKHNSIFPQSVFSKDNVCFTSSIYSIISDDDIELKYINAILNSSLMQFYCLYGINNQQNTTINLNQYMIRHLPVLNAASEIKNKLSNLVQRVINSLIESKGIYTGDVLSTIGRIEENIFELYDLESNERNIIISDIKNRVDLYKKVYN
ncbi:MAG: N-6 DNA methylase [Candidatus Lokiarchaeota archaeon]|nr:N-6 DNA methylase [Candidatus Lokiarchaeota archaeon]